MGYLELAKSFIKSQEQASSGCPEVRDGDAQALRVTTQYEKNENNEISQTASADVECSPDDGWDDRVTAAANPLKPPAWDAETAALIAWFSTAELPANPFDLRAATRVAEPQKFYASLRADIAAGPGGVRAAQGTLAVDLRDLRLAVQGSP
jgi:hypothetical protein